MSKTLIDKERLLEKLFEWYDEVNPDRDYSFHDEERKEALIQSGMIAEFIELIEMWDEMEGGESDVPDNR